MLLISILILLVLFVLYRKKRFDRKTWLFLSLLGLLGLGWSVYESFCVQRTEITSLQRSGIGGEKQSVTLQVNADDEEMELSLELEPEQYTEAEVAELLDQKCSELDEQILGENTSFQNICHPMNLPVSFEDSDISVSWYSNKQEVLSWDGTLGDDIDPAGEEVVLQGTLSLDGQSTEYERILTVFPEQKMLTLEEQIREAADQINQDTESTYLLPEKVGSISLHWYVLPGQKGIYLSILALLISLALIYIRKDKEKKAGEERKKLLEKDYPEVIGEMQLLLCAGLSMRKVFERMTSEYRSSLALQKRPRLKPAYEEIARTYYEMEGGVLEADAYEHLGERCGTASYKNLSVLLVQNLKKGGQGMVELLQQEVSVAWETRKRKARAEGEKVTVKLLLPMGMMLIVVLIVIIVPAMLSF